MEGIIITRASQPLKHNLQQAIARLLASAFAGDRGMLALLGQDRWDEIRAAYFHVQLYQPDCVLLACEKDTLQGVLIASTPAASFSFTTAMRQLFTMKRLLRQHYSRSQEISNTIAQQIPDTPHLYINQLAVEPSRQGRTIGRRLLAELDTLAGELPVYVDCETSLAPFYAQAGFSIRAAITADDLVVMERNGTSIGVL